MKNDPVRMIFCFLVLIIAGCSAFSQINILTDADEVALGRRCAEQVEREIPMYADPMVEAYIDSLGRVLAGNSERPEIVYYFKVVDTDEINAFALPGGYLYINRGLIAAADSESELAGVIAHEIGHVVGRHGAKQMTRQIGLSALIQAALGEDPGLIQSIVANIATTGAMMKYSREAEKEADSYAIDELYRSGIDPNGFLTFFDKLKSAHGRNPSNLEKFFASHPPTDERIENTKAKIAALPRGGRMTSDSDRFHMIRNRVVIRTAGN